MSVDLSQFDGHTPGPWREHDAGIETDARGEGIVVDRGITPANARLIASAPALLADLRAAREALRAIEATAGSTFNDDCGCGLCVVTRLARAAMEGEKDVT